MPVFRSGAGCQKRRRGEVVIETEVESDIAWAITSARVSSPITAHWSRLSLRSGADMRPDSLICGNLETTMMRRDEVCQGTDQFDTAVNVSLVISFPAQGPEDVA